MDDKIKNVVTAAVIKAISDNGPEFLADKAAQILNAPGDRGMYGSLFGYLGRFREDDQTYLETLIDGEIKAYVKVVIAEWFASKRDALRDKIIAHISAENIADAYIDKVAALMEQGGISVSVSLPSADDDDDD